LNEPYASLTQNFVSTRILVINRFIPTNSKSHRLNNLEILLAWLIYFGLLDFGKPIGVTAIVEGGAYLISL
jgi:hypothetical protein